MSKKVIMLPTSGDTIQLAMMVLILLQCTAPQSILAKPKLTIVLIIECVVETG